MDAVRAALPDSLRAQLAGAIERGLVPPGLAGQLPEALQPLLTTPEGLALLLGAALALLVLLAMVALSGGRGPRGSTVVIAGPPNAGKTTLFFQLKDGSLHNGVVASMGDNAAAIALRSNRGGAKRASLLDVPGHHSSRHRLEAALSDAAAVVFLVDAVDVTPHRTEAADMLYEVLTHPGVARSRVPILIACNKMDLEMEAHSVDFIRKTLEKQLDAMRRTRTAAIGKDAGGGAPPALGPPGKPFSFGGLANKVTLAQASAKTGALDEVVAFIAASV
jgi:signal recognition particle receptor subunit beta